MPYVQYQAYCHTYLAAQDDKVRPLFITQDGKGLTHQAFSALMNSVLSKCHLDTQCFNTHSFHIGAATSKAHAQ